MNDEQIMEEQKSPRIMKACTQLEKESQESMLQRGSDGNPLYTQSLVFVLWCKIKQQPAYNIQKQTT